VICRKDMTLAEAEVLALSTLKQVMEEKVRHSDRMFVRVD
jgi:20S proteasome alpha/beta subunit